MANTQGARIRRETVVAAALELLDEVGIDGLTMRRLAEALRIQAPSLYWHFANKQALLDGMADALTETVAREPAGAAPAWDERVRRTGHEMRQALRARRDGARVFAGTYVVTENVMRVGEVMIGALRDAGGSPEFATWGAFSVLYYVLGFVMEEQALDPSILGGIDPAERRGEFLQLAAAKFPHSLAVADSMFSMDFDARFTFGLDLLIGGMQAKLAKEAVR